VALFLASIIDVELVGDLMTRSGRDLEVMHSY